MEIDVILEPDLNPDQVAELAEQAEGFGIRAIWTQNYVASRDPFMCLMPAAIRTSKIGLGVVVISPYEMHPMKMANALLTLNECCKGRARMVVGGGGYWCAGMGIEPDRLVRAVRESIEIIRSGAKGEALRYEGGMYKARGYHASWVTDTPPLVYAGANREQMLRMGGRIADGIMMSDVPLNLVENAVQTVLKSVKDNDRDVDNFHISDVWAFHIKEDRELAIREGRRELLIRGLLEQWYLQSFMNDEDCATVKNNMTGFFKAYRARSHEIEGVPDRVVNQLLDNLTLTGGIDELPDKLEALRRFRAAGVTELALRLHDDPADAIKIIGEKLIPAL